MISKSELLQTLQERGYVYQVTDATTLDHIFASKKIRAYIGFDCTAPSLHVGSLIQIMMLRILQRFGHDPIVLLGGGTTRVGDPSGKDQMRAILSEDAITANKNAILQVFSKFIDFSNGAILADNAEWLSKLNYLDFLGKYGSCFTINKMLTFDSVKSRLDRQQPLTLLEFSYMIFQSYDFLELHKRYKCILQLGGSDQWGNIVSGVDLVRRVSGVDVFGITSPLLTTASGTKMGKTASGAIWLNPDMLSSYDYWQFWRNTADGDVIRFLKLFTELPMQEIDKLSQLQGAELNSAKIILANEATKLCHGLKAANAAMNTASSVFKNADFGTELKQLIVSAQYFSSGLPAFKVFVDAGLCSTGGEAKRLIAGKGAKVNNKVITSETELIATQHLNEGKLMLSAGKKKHAVIIVQQ